jgi:hypothetical protein
MKTLTETTTGTISSQMILNYCGDYAGRFQDEAFDLLSSVTDLPEFEKNQWCDIMFDRDGDVYAIWAEDALTCQNADAKYIQLDIEDCPNAFKKMNEKLENS